MSVVWRFECEICQEPVAQGVEPKLCAFRAEDGQPVQVSACSKCAKLVANYIAELDGEEVAEPEPKALPKLVGKKAAPKPAPADDETKQTMQLLLQTNAAILEALQKLNGTGQQQAAPASGEDRPVERPKRSNRNTGAQNKKPKGRSRSN